MLFLCALFFVGFCVLLCLPMGTQLLFGNGMRTMRTVLLLAAALLLILVYAFRVADGRKKLRRQIKTFCIAFCGTLAVLAITLTCLPGDRLLHLGGEVYLVKVVELAYDPAVGETGRIWGSEMLERYLAYKAERGYTYLAEEKEMTFLYKGEVTRTRVPRVIQVRWPG